MRAAVFHRIGDSSVDIVPDPKIEAADDVIVKVTTTCICESDLAQVFNQATAVTRENNFKIFPH